MSIHVAILKRPYLRGILDGWKTVESRLYRVPQPPFGRIVAGERIFLKVSAGPWMATAIASEVKTFDRLTPARVDGIRQEWGHAIGGDGDYWERKRNSTCAALIHLAQVEPLDVGPEYPKSQRAWHVLDESLSPLREISVTAGALRNRYAPFPVTPGDVSRWSPGDRLTLLLPDGTPVTTSLARGRMIRWRGWSRLYDSHNVQPGDRIRFVAVGEAAFRVSFRRGPR